MVSGAAGCERKSITTPFLHHNYGLKTHAVKNYCSFSSFLFLTIRDSRTLTLVSATLVAMLNVTERAIAISFHGFREPL